LYGTGSQFQGTGDLTVVPEPSTLIMGMALSFSGLSMMVLRRKPRA
jgi:hypothetical protein